MWGGRWKSGEGKFSISMKGNSFLSKSLIQQKNGVSDYKTKMQKLGTLIMVGVPAVFL